MLYNHAIEAVLLCDVIVIRTLSEVSNLVRRIILHGYSFDHEVESNVLSLKNLCEKT